MKKNVNNFNRRKKLTAHIAVVTVLLITCGSISTLAQTQSTTINSTAVETLQDAITLTGDYTLTSDITFSAGHGFIVAANGITLDGAGYKITGSKDVASCEWITATDPTVDTAGHGILDSGYDNIVIKNLEVENFATGIYLHGIGQNNVENVRIENCKIHDNGLDDMLDSSSECTTHGIHLVLCKQVNIIDNEIYSNEGTGMGCEAGGNGIFIFGGDSGQDLDIISGNEIHHNAKAGFWCKKQTDHVTLSNNDIYENGDGAGITDTCRGGVVLRCKSSNFLTIKNNNIHENNGFGLYIGGNHNTISHNIIVSNTQHGINFGRSDGSSSNYLSHNYLYDNAGLDVNSVHEDYGGDNTGENNAGTTAHNYRDEGTSGDTYFTYTPGPEKPSITGESNGEAGQEYEYTISATNPLIDEDIYCFIDWDDGSDSGWIGPYPSGEEVKVKHTWKKGTYSIKVKAKDIYGAESDWGTLKVTMPMNHQTTGLQSRLFQFLQRSFGHFTYVFNPRGRNVAGLLPPSIPTVTGPTEGDVGVECTFCAVATFSCSYADYQFDWDADGSHDYSSWYGPYNSGESCCKPHSWGSAGTYCVKARTRAPCGSTSGWSVCHYITISASGPAVSYSPSSHNFGDMGKDKTDSTTFEIWNSGTGALEYSLSESCDWVTVAPTSGSSTGEHDTITVNVDTTGLSPGSYTCLISITSNGGSGTFIVCVTVVETILSFSPNSHDFGNMSKDKTDSTTFEIWNSGTGALEYSLSESCDWVTVAPTSGSSTGEHDTITVNVDTTGLSPGSYGCDVSISSNGGNDVFTAHIFISAPPDVPFIAGSITGKAGTEYDYTFVTTDPNGDDVYYYIEWGDDQVEEWIGPYKSGEEATVSHTWTEEGTYSIKAKAKDVHDAESDWGTLEVTMPKNKVSQYEILLRFLEHFPVLKNLLGY